MNRALNASSTAAYWTCWAFDCVPTYSFAERRWYAHGGLGCYPLRISRFATWLYGKGNP